MHLQIKISDRIKRARESAGWTQARLAEAIGVHPQTVRGWERGKMIGLDHFLIMLDALKIGMLQFLGTSGHELNLDGLSTEAIARIAWYVQLERSAK